MTRQDILEALRSPQIITRPGAERAEIDRAEHDGGWLFPDDLRSVFAVSNGLEGFLGSDAYLLVWSAADVVPLNRAYGIHEYAPGVVLFGTDGSDNGYGFVRNGATVMYVRVPLIGMSLDAVEPLGESLDAAIDRIRKSTP